MVRYGNKGSTAAALHHLGCVGMAGSVDLWLGQVKPRIVGIVESAHLVAQSALHALARVHFGVEKTQGVGHHTYGVVGTDARAGRAATALCWVRNLYHQLKVKVIFVFQNPFGEALRSSTPTVQIYKLSVINQLQHHNPLAPP